MSTQPTHPDSPVTKPTTIFLPFVSNLQNNELEEEELPDIASADFISTTSASTEASSDEDNLPLSRSIPQRFSEVLTRQEWLKNKAETHIYAFDAVATLFAQKSSPLPSSLLEEVARHMATVVDQSLVRE
ncbi:hypothetical protein C2S51_020359 [Perilla frutescens var. frutescens]|nr:hypothetical protein C2S51_020359 [Perilla frutescens var. frutescens]